MLCRSERGLSALWLLRVVAEALESITVAVVTLWLGRYYTASLWSCICAVTVFVRLGMVAARGGRISVGYRLSPRGSQLLVALVSLCF